MDLQMLKALLEKAKISIDVAVVLSCHSEYIGKMFLKAGIKHVICVGREYTIKDDACIAFAKIFYKRLFDGSGRGVCEIFKFAVADVKAQFGILGNRGEESQFR